MNTHLGFHHVRAVISAIKNRLKVVGNNFRHDGQSNSKASYGIFCDHKALQINEGKRLSVKEPQAHDRSEIKSGCRRFDNFEWQKFN